MTEPEAVERICRLFHPTCWDAVPEATKSDFSAFVRRMVREAAYNTLTVEQAMKAKAELNRARRKAVKDGAWPAVARLWRRMKRIAIERAGGI